MRKLVKNQPVVPPVDQLEELTDEELLLRYRDQRDRAAFAVLVKRYEQPLFNYLCRYFNDTTLADDVFQMSFLQVHLKCDTYDGSRPFRPWLYTIAAHQAINLQRARKRRPTVSLDRNFVSNDNGRLASVLPNDDHNPADEAEDNEQFAELRRLVAELPPNTRSALLLVYFQGMKYREAAEELDVPVGTVKRRVHSAIERLYNKLQQARSQRPR
jgi:RNA polymerase sigma-70 factor (ECF subfamily)